MEQKPAGEEQKPEAFQIDLAEAFRRQINYQAEILKSAISKLRSLELEELPPLPPPKVGAP